MIISEEALASIDISYAKEELETYASAINEFFNKHNIEYRGVNRGGSTQDPMFHADFANRKTEAFPNLYDLKVQLLMWPFREERNKINEIRYHRTIKSPEENKFLTEPKDFLIASEVFPTAYHWANSLGLRANIDYNHWHTHELNKVGIELGGFFERTKWPEVINFVKTIDNLIDAHIK